MSIDVSRQRHGRLGREVERARVPLVWWIALLGLGAVSCVLLAGRLNVAWPWQDHYRVDIEVANATAVAAGNEVRLAGVAVGRVTAVRLDRGKPVVAASIDSRYRPIHRDARVVVRPNTPLADMYIDILDRGTPAAGEIADDGRLTADRTRSPVQIGEVFDLFDADVRPRVRASIDTLGGALDGNGAALRQALVELAPFLDAAARLTREIAHREHQTRRLVHNLAQLSGELGRRTRQVQGLVRDGATTLSALATVEQPLAELVEELPPTLAEMPRSLTAVRAAAHELNPALEALLPVADALGPALASLRGLSPVATRALSRLDATLPQLATVLDTATPIARNLNASFSALRPQVPKLEHVAAAIVPCELSVRKFFNWTPSVFKFSGLHGAFPRGNINISPDTASSALGGNVKAPFLTKSPSCAGPGTSP